MSLHPVTTFQDLPLEILHEIAKVSDTTYKGILSIPRFGRSIKPGTMVDFMIHFGYSIKITSHDVIWKKWGRRHTPWDSTPNTHISKINEKVKKFYWYSNGKPYRTLDRPTEVVYTKTKIRTIRTLKWFSSLRVLHRLNKPAVITYFNDKIKSKQWWIDGIQTKKVMNIEMKEGGEYKKLDVINNIWIVKKKVKYGFRKQWYKLDERRQPIVFKVKMYDHNRGS